VFFKVISKFGLQILKSPEKTQSFFEVLTLLCLNFCVDSRHEKTANF